MNTKEILLKRPQTKSFLRLKVPLSVSVPEILDKYPGWQNDFCGRFTDTLCRVLEIDPPLAVKVEHRMEQYGPLDQMPGTWFRELAWAILDEIQSEQSK